MPIVTQPPSITEAFVSHHSLDLQPPSTSFPPSTCGPSSRMTRGRKKDLTIPPTRALVQQRDYRARRARYVSDLEERVRKAEEENEKLRHELAAARSGQAAAPSTLDLQRAHASSELMHNLSNTSASLARFHRLVFPEHRHSSQDSHLSVSAGPSSYSFSQPSTNTMNILRTASFPSPAPSPPNVYTIMEQSTSRITESPRRKRLYREDSPESVVSPLEGLDRQSESRASSPCCGGIMDCRELIERVDSGATDDLDLAPPRIRQRMDSPDSSYTMRHDLRRY